MGLRKTVYVRFLWWYMWSPNCNFQWKAFLSLRTQKNVCVAVWRLIYALFIRDSMNWRKRPGERLRVAILNRGLSLVSIFQFLLALMNGKCVGYTHVVGSGKGSKWRFSKINTKKGKTTTIVGLMGNFLLRIYFCQISAHFFQHCLSDVFHTLTVIHSEYNLTFKTKTSVRKTLSCDWLTQQEKAKRV